MMSRTPIPATGGAGQQQPVLPPEADITGGGNGGNNRQLLHSTPNEQQRQREGSLIDMENEIERFADNIRSHAATPSPIQDAGNISSTHPPPLSGQREREGFPPPPHTAPRTEQGLRAQTHSPVFPPPQQWPQYHGDERYSSALAQDRRCRRDNWDQQREVNTSYNPFLQDGPYYAPPPQQHQYSAYNPYAYPPPPAPYMGHYRGDMHTPRTTLPRMWHGKVEAWFKVLEAWLEAKGIWRDPEKYQVLLAQVDERAMTVEVEKTIDQARL